MFEYGWFITVMLRFGNEMVTVFLYLGTSRVFSHFWERSVRFRPIIVV